LNFSRRKYFTKEDDQKLLRRCLLRPPTRVKHGEKRKYWKDTAEILGFENSKQVRDRFTPLMYDFSRKSNKEKKDSGKEKSLTGEELEMEENLEKLKDYQDEKKMDNNFKKKRRLKVVSDSNVATEMVNSMKSKVTEGLRSLESGDDIKNSEDKDSDEVGDEANEMSKIRDTKSES